MSNDKKLIFSAVILSFLTAVGICQDRYIKNGSDYTLTNSIWYAKGDNFYQGDSLEFTSKTDVQYFMGELGWEFDSKYKISGDTLIIQTICAAFEVNDISGYKPDLIQKYQINKDSLILIYSANYRNNQWIEADEERYKMINGFKKIK
jgi:hypothetical protein